MLEAMGIVRTAVGSGPDAGAIVAADPAAPSASALRLHMATRTLPIHDVVQTRTCSRSWAVQEAAAAGHRDLDFYGHRHPARRDGRRGPLTRGVPSQLDADLHVAMAGLAGNVLVEAMMVSLRDSIHGYVMPAFRSSTTGLRSRPTSAASTAASSPPSLADTAPRPPNSYDAHRGYFE